MPFRRFLPPSATYRRWDSLGFPPGRRDKRHSEGAAVSKGWVHRIRPLWPLWPQLSYRGGISPGFSAGARNAWPSWKRPLVVLDRPIRRRLLGLVGSLLYRGLFGRFPVCGTRDARPALDRPFVVVGLVDPTRCPRSRRNPLIGVAVTRGGRTRDGWATHAPACLDRKTPLGDDEPSDPTGATTPCGGP